MRVKITKALVKEFDERALNHAPYDRMTKAGEYEVSAEELAELQIDAEYQGDVNDCSGIESPPQTKAMYRRFYHQVLEVRRKRS